MTGVDVGLLGAAILLGVLLGVRISISIVDRERMSRRGRPDVVDQLGSVLEVVKALSSGKADVLASRGGKSKKNRTRKRK